MWVNMHANDHTEKNHLIIADMLLSLLFPYDCKIGNLFAFKIQFILLIFVLFSDIYRVCNSLDNAGYYFCLLDPKRIMLIRDCNFSVV